MGKKKLILLLLFSLAIIPFIYAADFNHVISNSDNWQDVYSTIHYANLQKIDNDFLTSTNHGQLLLNGISKTKTIQVITSEGNEFVFNYPNSIISKGFERADEITLDEANLELIEELENINNFIIVSDAYGYDAIAVAPYAILTNSWVFLVNSQNANEIDQILSERNVEKILTYGYLDREIRDTFQKYNPETINTGDKFENNIGIVKKYLRLKNTKQVLLTNGEFIEKELMTGKNPILFTGNENVPEKISEYLKNSEIEIGVLIGNDLMSAATNIRRNTGISVMVKFARGARSKSEGISAVEGLDLFPVPTPILKLEIEEVKYNTVMEQLEVTYKSNANLPMYLKGTITINDRGETKRMGDSDPIFIAPGSYKTTIYPFETTSEKLNATIYTIFGETETSLDFVLQKTLEVDTVEIIDRCEIDIKTVKYNKQSKEFIIDVKNTAPVACWVALEIEDIEIESEETTIGTNEATKISKRSSRKITITQELLEEDIEKNAFVNVVAQYGERQTSLIKILDGRFELKIKTLTTLTYLIIAVILIITTLFFLYKKAKHDEEEGY
ncbi:MAG TPA: cell wall-binding repeat-containing protein [Candidatus Nanoarchaeia archaeon]|nr:cell wall-binding repeat-containing protein [Candidatus Nanoarchaeia archaeon]